MAQLRLLLFLLLFLFFFLFFLFLLLFFLLFFLDDDLVFDVIKEGRELLFVLVEIDLLLLFLVLFHVLELLLELVRLFLLTKEAGGAEGSMRKISKINVFEGSRGFLGSSRQLSTCWIDWRGQIQHPEGLDQSKNPPTYQLYTPSGSISR